MLILSGDIGGTNTRLQLSRYENKRLTVIVQADYPNIKFKNLTDIINAFTEAHHDRSQAIQTACFGVAGPIVNNTVKCTNLPWFVDAQVLAEALHIPNIFLINDFEAIGYGLSTLTDTDMATLQKGKPQEHAVKSIIGAGTGLGVGLAMWTGDHYSVIPTEGGHVDFSPTDEEQIALFLYLRKKFHRVSAERVVSGIGLTNIYKFVRDNPKLGEKENPALQLALHQFEDIGAQIAEYATQHNDAMAARALQLFIHAYGSVAGNLALTSLCLGGLYLVGGIAPKLLPQLKKHGFIEAFTDKGRMSKLICDIPIYVVLNTHVGLQGAAVYASLQV